MEPEKDYRLSSKSLKYHYNDKKLGFLVFYTIESEPDIVKVYELIKNMENSGKRETFDVKKFLNLFSSSTYLKILEELGRTISKYALLSRNTRLILNLKEKPIHLNSYDSVLAEILTKETEDIVKNHICS